MTGTPLHPALVHLPLGLALVLPLLAPALAVAIWRGLASARAFWIAAALQALLVAGGFAAIRTGEADEERVERVVPEASIEAHEDAADRFVAAAAGALILLVAGAAVGDRRGAHALRAAGAAATVVVLALGIDVGRKGGEIVYVHGGAAAFTGAGAGPGAAAGSPAVVPGARERHGDEE